MLVKGKRVWVGPVVGGDLMESTGAGNIGAGHGEIC